MRSPLAAKCVSHTRRSRCKTDHSKKLRDRSRSLSNESLPWAIFFTWERAHATLIYRVSSLSGCISSPDCAGAEFHFGDDDPVMLRVKIKKKNKKKKPRARARGIQTCGKVFGTNLFSGRDKNGPRYELLSLYDAIYDRAVPSGFHGTWMRRAVSRFEEKICTPTEIFRLNK